MILRAAASGLEGMLKGHTSLNSARLKLLQFVPEALGLLESRGESDLVAALGLCIAPWLAMFLD